MSKTQYGKPFYLPADSLTTLSNLKAPNEQEFDTIQKMKHSFEERRNS